MIKPPKPLRIPDLRLRKQAGGPKLTMLTAYDAWLARLLAQTGAVDILLVGDSLGMVQLGHSTTVPVTMADMVRHAAAVRRGAPDALVVADLPFLSAHISLPAALRNAGLLMQEGGATAVKIEGGLPIVPLVERLLAAGIPVMGHLGLQPQSVHTLGGFRRQAQTREAQDRVLAEGRALQAAGVFAIVLESVPDALGHELSTALDVPVIGIGAGPGCDGQVLVSHDLLGLTGPHVPSFVKRYANAGEQIASAVAAFAADVGTGRFPAVTGQPLLTVARRVADLRSALAAARRAGQMVGFVPTMGALHAGHAQLLAEARRENDFVVASIFVNPLQFDRADDLVNYPRTEEADLALCREHGVDLVFAPGVDDLYPGPQLTFVDLPAMSETLCGAYRPGHFRGVATVVLKLLHLVEPDRAYFGQKDAQQLAIIRRMVRDLDLRVQVVPVPTVREPDGLALSSRNRRLTPQQRAIAPVLARALTDARAALDRGERAVAAMRPAIEQLFTLHPEAKLEYFEWVDPETLAPVAEVNGPVLIAGAFWLGTTRLIDNVFWP